MKKFLFLGIMIMLIFSSVAGAEIRNETDQFTGSLLYKSVSQIEKGSLSLNKINGKLRISFRTVSSNLGRFIKEPMLVNFNTVSEEKLDVCEVLYEPTPIMRDKQDVAFISVTAIVPPETSAKIITANRVALKFYKDKGEPVIIVLSNEVLAEWKQVINTTE